MWRLGEKVDEAGADGLEVTTALQMNVWWTATFDSAKFHLLFLASDSNNVLITPPE